ncbi:tripartite tricarboxylate transporter TctB family protein [Kribbella sp. VKM Ac-2527]|uniref:Tripartite tricarboxylate transporter TctB family protein n=1 Tax=Kribbella caucasensis TaxID=2512215 RepID=A0A4R6KPF3_9ACTN|nr:tripartite tricarboxylate transporter TctB family protein [Kribbella sp. VKM Ac-2527]TDO52565.1 tripartite tricarboxylate transporter TctB family protein [Kribbella sp. VKM Ac-2527]
MDASYEEERPVEEERPPPAGAWSQLTAALVAALLGVAGLIGSWRLGLGRLTEPGPGLWPFVISVVITLLSVVLAIIGRQALDSERFNRASLLVVVAVVTLVLLAVAMPLIGFEIPSLLLTFVWLRFLGKESWRSSIVISVVTVVAFHLLFVTALQIPLPRLV